MPLTPPAGGVKPLWGKEGKEGKEGIGVRRKSIVRGIGVRMSDVRC